VPAAAVIPAPRVYTKAVAIKALVVGSRHLERIGPERGGPGREGERAGQHWVAQPPFGHPKPLRHNQKRNQRRKSGPGPQRGMIDFMTFRRKTPDR